MAGAAGGRVREGAGPSLNAQAIAHTLAVWHDGAMGALGLPFDPNGPLFVYGLLKPGELAYSFCIEKYVSEARPVTVRGSIRLRDGLPLLDVSGRSVVSGYLLRFYPTKSMEAWDTLQGFESDKHYRYGTVEVHVDDECVPANVLVGHRIDRGTAGESAESWSIVSDPVFVEGLAEVLAMTLETAPNGVASQPDGPNYWRMFFRLQATYLLLWSIVERYTVLRYGPRLEPWPRIKQLNDDPVFQAAVVEAGASPRAVYDSRSLEKVELRADGTKAGEYFYQVRSNLSHRGKSAFRDGQLVLEALVDLHDTMRRMLARQVPCFRGPWQQLHPDGWLLRPNFRQDTAAGLDPRP